MQIIKAKLTSIGYLEVEYKENFFIEGDKKTIEVSKKCTYDPHPDLLNAFSSLRLFLVELCEQVKEVPTDKDELDALLSDYKVTGFTIGGSDEHEGVTLIGRKALKNNRVLNLVSPFTKWEDEHNAYKNSYSLALRIGDCQREVEEYLEGKAAPKLQLELELETSNQ